MKIYRAVPLDNYEEKKLYTRQPTRRTPSNVPYLIDNIWEFLRPEKFPSRRFAAYASPTKELALENASAYDSNGFIATEVVFLNKKYKMAQLQVSDARFHKDIKELTKNIMEFFGKDFSNFSIEKKMKHAALFMPAVSKDELTNYFDTNEETKILKDIVLSVSTFWKDASLVMEEHDGELFFELLDGCSYSLKV